MRSPIATARHNNKPGGNTINRHLAEVLTIDEVHDENLFVARSAMRVVSEDFVLVFKFSNHVPANSSRLG